MKENEKKPKPGTPLGRSVSRAFVIIIAAPPILLLLFAIMLLFKSCELFGASVFPDYLPSVEARVTLTDAAPEFKGLDYARDDYSIKPRFMRNGAGEEYLFVNFEPHIPGVQPAMAAYTADLQHLATFRAADFGGWPANASFAVVDMLDRFAFGLGDPINAIYAFTDVRAKASVNYPPQLIERRPACSAFGLTHVFAPPEYSGWSTSLTRESFNTWAPAIDVQSWQIDPMFNNYQVLRAVYDPSRLGAEVGLLLLRADNRIFLLYLPIIGVQNNTLALPLASNYPFLQAIEMSDMDRSRISLTADGAVWYDEKNQQQVLLRPDGGRLSRESDMDDIKLAYYEPSGAGGYYVMRRKPEIFKVRSWWR